MNQLLRRLRLACLWMAGIAVSCAGANPLVEGFAEPPLDAKPKTWLHAMSSNMSREGLTMDLEAIAGAGIGGVQLFNVTQRIPRGRVHYNTEEHRELIRHAMAEADRLSLTFDIHNCDGWSSSGGPWVTPEDSMKMVVWSSQLWRGGKGELQLNQPTVREDLYRDIAVLAYPSLDGEKADAEAQFEVTASHPDLDIPLVTDGRWEESSVLGEGESGGWIQFSYDEEFTARSLLVVHELREGEVELQYSDDGREWTSHGLAGTIRTGKGEWMNHDTFAPLTARFFRLVFPKRTAIKDIRLSALPAVDNLIGRNALGNAEDIGLEPLADVDASTVIDPGDIIDLTDAMQEDGVLGVDLPAGDWTILRIGYTSTGAFNNPASPEGRGLECDKLDAGAFRRHWDAFIARIIEENPEYTGNAFQSVLIDSYEAGGQNWTRGFEDAFKERKGYSLMDYLPVLTGRYVESAAVTEAVLYDFRQVVGDLMETEYYGTFADLCHQHGLKSYIEPYGFGPLKDLDIGKFADVPMGEFWSTSDSFRGLQAARSSASIYGRNIVAAESFTSFPEINWKGHPGMLKTKGDIAMTYGINRFVFHRYAHQANTHVEPGMTMNTWGFHFDRTQTWWDSAGAAFFEYLARCSHVLQSGIPVADVALYEGDGAPASPMYGGDLEKLLPQGYLFDNLNRDGFFNRTRIHAGRLALAGGNSYRVLALRPGVRIELETLLRLRSVVEAGIPLVGDRPKGIPRHGFSEADHAHYANLVEAIWNRDNVFPWGAFAEALASVNLSPALEIAGRPDIRFVHRRIDGLDTWFFYNPDPEERTFTCRFRATGSHPQFWDPMTGERYRLLQFSTSEGLTETTIRLEANGSAVVVFGLPREAALPVAGFHQTPPVIRKELTVEGDWLVDFGPGPGPLDFPELLDWKDHPDDAVRHFSGTARYVNSFRVEKGSLEAGLQYLLDLGTVEICARVIVNGEDLGVLWKQPYSIDITGALVPGDNELVIEVTNLWTNRLIGEERLPDTSGYSYPGKDSDDMPEWYVRNEPQPEGPRTTFTTARFYEADDSLVSSGLLGPVRILVRK